MDFKPRVLILGGLLLSVLVIGGFTLSMNNTGTCLNSNSTLGSDTCIVGDPADTSLTVDYTNSSESEMYARHEVKKENSSSPITSSNWVTVTPNENSTFVYGNSFSYSFYEEGNYTYSVSISETQAESGIVSDTTKTFEVISAPAPGSAEDSLIDYFSSILDDIVSSVQNIFDNSDTEAP